MMECANSHNLRIQDGGSRHLGFRKKCQQLFAYLLQTNFIKTANIKSKKTTQSIQSCISQSSKTAKIKMFIDYKRKT